MSNKKAAAKKNLPKKAAAPASKPIKSLALAAETAAAPPTGGFPPTLPFMIKFCTDAEHRAVADDEILSSLYNVGNPVDFPDGNLFLNGKINATYHIPAGVAHYSGGRPNLDLSVRGAAVDIQNDLAKKGITVPLE